jgi:hypothetical protein
VADSVCFGVDEGVGVEVLETVGVGEVKEIDVSSSGLQIPRLASTFRRLLSPVVVSAM